MRFLVREVDMVLVVPIVVIASMQTLRGVIMLRGSAFVTLDGEVRHIKTILIYNVSVQISQPVQQINHQAYFIFLGVKCDSIGDHGRYGTNCQKRCECEANGSSCHQQFGNNIDMFCTFVIRFIAT